MAHLKLFSIRDIKVSSYMRPFCEINEINAVRGLKIVVNDHNSQISHYPEDFELMELGTFDDVTGRMMLHDSPKFIINALTLKIQAGQEAMRKAFEQPTDQVKGK